MKYILQSLDWDTDKTLAIFGYEEDDIRVDPTDREKKLFLADAKLICYVFDDPMKMALTVYEEALRPRTLTQAKRDCCMILFRHNWSSQKD